MALTHPFSLLRAPFPLPLLASEAARSECRVPPALNDSGTIACADQERASAISRAMSCAAASIALNVPGGAAATVTAAAGDPGFGLSSGSSAEGDMELDVDAGGGAVAFAEGETAKSPVQSPWRADRLRSSPPAFEEMRKKPFQDMSRDVAKNLFRRLTEGGRIERYEPDGSGSRPAPSGG